MDIISIERLKREELKRIEIPEKEFHSDAEAGMVLMDEIWESEEELKAVQEHFETFKDSYIQESSGQIQTNRAEKLAAEAVQVSAVAQKFINMELKEQEDEKNM